MNNTQLQCEVGRKGKTGLPNLYRPLVLNPSPNRRYEYLPAVGSAAQTPEFCGSLPQNSERWCCMARPRGTSSYRRHKQSGQAVVTLTDPSGARRDANCANYPLRPSHCYPGLNQADSRVDSLPKQAELSTPHVDSFPELSTRGGVRVCMGCRIGSVEEGRLGTAQTAF